MDGKVVRDQVLSLPGCTGRAGGDTLSSETWQAFPTAAETPTTAVRPATTIRGRVPPTLRRSQSERAVTHLDPLWLP